jgi:PAS domain S-box-containing protein
MGEKVARKKIEGEWAAFDWQSEVQRRRNTILNYLLLAGVIGGGIALFVLFLPTDMGPLERLAEMYPFLLGWLVILIIWLLRARLGYRVRAWTLLIFVYLMGFFLFLDGGLAGSGRVWLLLFPTLAVIMLDVWPGGVIAGIFSILTYVFFALVIGLNVIPFKSDDPSELNYWITESGDFLIAVVGLILGMWGFRRGWFEALHAVSTINERLEEIMADVQILNTQLDTRVIERTRQLSDALARNAAVLEGIADGVVVFDQDGRASSVNPAMGVLLGHNVDEIVGCTIEEMMGQDVSATDQELIGRLLRDGEITWSGFKLRWGAKTFAVSIAPVHEEATSQSGMVAVFRDFTREAEIDRMKSLFLSIASHDLRAPLSSILGYVEMLNEGIYGDMTEEQRDIVERIVANTRHMMGLANNLLDRAQIEAGTLQLNVAPFSPSELVDDVVKVMDVLARTRGLELSGEVAAKVPHMILGDSQRLSQILLNLVGNAIKFTEKGSVRVRVYLSDVDHWALEVVDTGYGIPKASQASVFEPFQRGKGVGEYSGAGLGLSIVKQMAKKMGGDVMLESDLGQGCTFTVVLPLEQADVV